MLNESLLCTGNMQPFHNQAQCASFSIHNKTRTMICDQLWIYPKSQEEMLL